MSVLGAIRDDAVNLPLFLHVLGAMALVGVVFTVAAATLMSRREGADALGLRRLGFKTTLYAALPSYLVMRVGAQWTEAEENLPPEVEESTWVNIGYIVAELGLLLLIVSMVLSAIGLRRLRAADGAGGGGGQARAIGIISALLLVAYLVAIFAMSTKLD